MPSRGGLYSHPRAPGKSDSYIGVADDDIDHAQRGGTTATDNSFTSALDSPSPLRPTALRRRGSDGGSSAHRISMSSYHSRSRTMDNTSDPHPLRRSSSTTKSARQDMGSTRPRLSRALTPSTSVLARPNPPVDTAAESHRTVLVHEVSPDDSLAGVALKHGISVAELRHANQLWTSDSIHLRQILYIPLDKARHVSLETVASLLAQRADSEEDTNARPSVASPHSRSDPGADPRSSDRPSVVRRIPSRTLSFFPPPSSNSSALAGGLLPRPASSSSSSSPSRATPPAATASTPSKASTLTSTIRATALTSLFSVLPINASTRDEILSHLSIDSDEAEHELTAVPTTPKRRPLAPVSMPITTPTNSRRKSRARQAWLSDSRDGEEGYTRDDDVEQIALASSPIHTTQMQPAAAMQLPGSMMRSSSTPKGAPLADSLNGAWRPPSDHHPQMR